MTLASMIEYENFRLKYVRMWCMTGLILNALLQLNHQIQGKLYINVWVKVFHWTVTFLMALGVFLSYKRNIKAIYWVILLYQLRTFQGFFQVNDVCESDDPKKILMLQMLVLSLVWFNHFMIFTLFNKWRNKISLVTFLTTNVGFAHKAIGLQNFKEHYLSIIVYVILSLNGALFYNYIYAALINLNIDQIQNMSKI